MTPVTRLLAVLLAVSACLIPAIQRVREAGIAPERTFVVPPARPGEAAGPLLLAEFVSPEGLTPSVHVASVCETPDGRLAAAWYGGTKEGAKDVRIFLSTRRGDAGGTWSRPRVIASAESAERDLRRPIRKVGNAVLFAGAEGRLGLVFVTVSLGGWSGSALNLMTSDDGGTTWSGARRLTLSPFFNVSELVKNNPLPLSDGSWAVPIYHDLFRSFPEILWLGFGAAGGDVSWKKTRISGGGTGFQPALVPLGPREVVALLRPDGGDDQIRLVRSRDGGRSWDDPVGTGLSNPGSGLGAVRLFDGRLLVAFNDSRTDRSNLRFAISADGGRTWARRSAIEAEPGSEFSYPYLIQSKGGLVHLVYTWKRKRIRHVAFNTSWLDLESGR